KIIAIVCMFSNHMANALFPVFPRWMQIMFFAIGGFTFPIMAFFIVEGYKHTSNIKKYLLRVFLAGVAAQIPFTLIFGNYTLNVMFTIFLGIVTLLLYDKIKNKVVFGVIFVLTLVLQYFVSFDWGIAASIVILLYQIIKNENWRKIIPPIFAGIMVILLALRGGGLSNIHINFVILAGPYILCCFLSAILLLCYNGERGRKSKYLFYAFYPVHLAILAGIAYALDIIDFSILRFWG
ncbi:MAG: conjugal transfer protein TraX, partial [Defluviitaleaceae bacterium]|nr:conjugal transfer protein TraX [Defluviitaleaceae bacterium]